MELAPGEIVPNRAFPSSFLPMVTFNFSLVMLCMKTNHYWVWSWIIMNHFRVEPKGGVTISLVFAGCGLAAPPYSQSSSALLTWLWGHRDELRRS